MSFVIQENIPLKNLTTMRVGGPARYFVEVKNADELKDGFDWAKDRNLPVFILGGGSNLVVSDRGFPGLVIRPNILGFEVVGEDGNRVLLKVGAGEVWDKVVEYAVSRGWWGIENLSLIHGSVGGLTVQNAGAYGAEIGEVVAQVEVYDSVARIIREFAKDDCYFTYRSSFFQRAGHCIITSVVLSLKKTGTPNINYPDVAKYFAEKNITSPTLSDVRSAIVFIRQNKLPDPGEIGSAGSFFKNLLLSTGEYQKLKEKISVNFGSETTNKLEEMKNRFVTSNGIKIPSAWLVELCGLKGASVSGAAIYEKQALIIVNKNNQATADDVLQLFKKVRQTVYAKTGLELLPEPVMVGFSDEELAEYFQLEASQVN